METKNYNALDLCKFFMMIVVISVHTGVDYGWTNGVAVRAYSVLADLAVQSFFLISGFLLGIRLKEPFFAPRPSRR